MSEDVSGERLQKVVTIWSPMKRPRSRVIFLLSVLWIRVLSSDCLSHLFELFSWKAHDIVL